MVVWLYVSEVVTITSGETIVSVKLENGVLNRTSGLLGVGKTCSEVKVVTGGGVGGCYGCPYQFFNWVVKGEAGFSARARGDADRFNLVLKLVNEVFVAHLGETTTFFSVEVDVINIECTS